MGQRVRTEVLGGGFLTGAVQEARPDDIELRSRIINLLLLTPLHRTLQHIHAPSIPSVSSGRAC